MSPVYGVFCDLGFKGQFAGSGHARCSHLQPLLFPAATALCMSFVNYLLGEGGGVEGGELRSEPGLVIIWHTGGYAQASGT